LINVKLYSGEKTKLYDYLIAKEHSAEKIQVRFLRGSKMASFSGLFDETAAALQFPWYFGENWNAYDECLSDLSWIDCDKLVLCVLDSQMVLGKEPDGLHVWLNHLLGVLEERSEGDSLQEGIAITLVLESDNEGLLRLQGELNEIPFETLQF